MIQPSLHLHLLGRLHLQEIRKKTTPDLDLDEASECEMSGGRSGRPVQMPSKQPLEDDRSRMDSRASIRADSFSSRRSRNGSSHHAAADDADAAAAAADRDINRNLGEATRITSTWSGNKQPAVVADPPGTSSSSSATITTTTVTEGGNSGCEAIDLSWLEEGNGRPAPVTAAPATGPAVAGVAGIQE